MLIKNKFIQLFLCKLKLLLYTIVYTNNVNKKYKIYKNNVVKPTFNNDRSFNVNSNIYV